MIKNRKNYFFHLILFFLILQPVLKIKANESQKFLTLKNDEVNLRQGPSFNYPIKLTYKKKYLPIVIIDQSETWRQVQDFEKNSGWIHISQLSKRKSGINIKNNSIIYNKPTIYSKPTAKLELGRLVLIEKCKIDWCKVKTGGYVGWVDKNSLWGNVK